MSAETWKKTKWAASGVAFVLIGISSVLDVYVGKDPGWFRGFAFCSFGVSFFEGPKQ